MNYLEMVRPYAEAFQRTKYEYGLTQESLLRQGDRPADFSAVFRYLNGSTKTIPRAKQTLDVYERLCEDWDIQDGILVRKNQITQTRNATPFLTTELLRVHKNYAEAGVGAAVQQQVGGEIWILNTYLTNQIHNEEASSEDIETLKNWLKNGKTVRILLLRPDGKAMRLRARAKLAKSGATLASKLFRDLEELMQMQQECSSLLEVKLMDELPGMATVILSNRLFFGLHYSFGHSENGPYYEATDIGNETYTFISRHFSEIWGDPSRAFPLCQELVDDIKHGLHVANNELEYLVNSTWKVHLHDLGDMIKGGKSAPFNSTIGPVQTWMLEITKSSQEVYLKTKLNIGDNYILDANLITERILDTDYAHIRFSGSKKLSIHLSFQCSLKSSQDVLLGFAIINSGSDSCSCYIVLEKNTNTNTSSVGLPPYFQRLLTFRDGSYMSLERTRKERDGFNFPYAGIYKVYSYGGPKGGDKCIKINWLKIDESGIARYKNQNYDELFGRATHIDPNLHLVFTHYKNNAKQRRSYLILSVNKMEPMEGRFYSGVHLGVSWEKHMPVGKRFILEFVENLDFNSQKAQKVKLHSKQYREIPLEIRRLLSGRIKNLLGFLRTEGQIADFQDIKKEWDKSINLGTVFYESAIQNVRLGEYDNAAKMLLRAVNHGFDDLDTFKKKALEVNQESIAKMQNQADYQVVEQLILEGGESFDPHI